MARRASIELKGRGKRAVVKVTGSGFPPGTKASLELVEVAPNGDRRSARYRPQVAGKEHPIFDPGVIDFDEPVLFGKGTLEAELQYNGRRVARESFDLG